MPSSDALARQISKLDYVKDFQKAETRLHADLELWKDYEKMKELQKEAVLYQQIGKIQAFKETSHTAQQLEKRLKENPLVEDYFIKMQDVNDLLQYVTREMEGRFQVALEEMRRERGDKRRVEEKD